MVPELIREVQLGARTISFNFGAFAYYRRLERVRSFVLEHYAEPITLDDAARVAGMERTAFSHFFHDKTGLCFRDWLAAIRIDKAIELMATRNLTVPEVAAGVGFGSLRTFQRVFSRVTGSPPAAFKTFVRPC